MGVNKTRVQEAREALLARGKHPSIDAVRVELGNTGSKTTIQRYLRMLDHPSVASTLLSEQLSRSVENFGKEVSENAPLDAADLQDRVDIEWKRITSFETQHRELVDQEWRRIDSFEAQQQQLINSLQEQSRLRDQYLERYSQRELDLETQLSLKQELCDSLAKQLSEMHLTLKGQEMANTAIRNCVESLQIQLTELSEKHQDQRKQDAIRHDIQLQQMRKEQMILQTALSRAQNDLERANRSHDRISQDKRMATHHFQESRDEWSQQRTAYEQQLKRLREDNTQLRAENCSLSLDRASYIGRLRGALHQIRIQAKTIRRLHPPPEGN